MLSIVFTIGAFLGRHVCQGRHHICTSVSNLSAFYLISPHFPDCVLRGFSLFLRRSLEGSIESCMSFRLHALKWVSLALELVSLMVCSLSKPCSVDFRSFRFEGVVMDYANLSRVKFHRRGGGWRKKHSTLCRVVGCGHRPSSVFCRIVPLGAPSLAWNAV